MPAQEFHSFTHASRQPELLNRSKRSRYLMSKRTDMKGCALYTSGDASCQNQPASLAQKALPLRDLIW
jgi:hypothetical protein